MMYGVFFGQLMDVGQPAASGLPSRFVVGVKAVLLGLCVLGLVGGLRRTAGTKLAAASEGATLLP